MTSRPQAKRSFPSLDTFDEQVREQTTVAASAPKRRLTQALASAADVLRRNDPTTNKLRAARGYYDHVSVQPRQPEVDGVGDYTAEPMATALHEDERAALADFDRQAYPQSDGRSMTSDLPDSAFPPDMPRDEVDNLLMHWKDAEHRREFARLLKLVPPDSRRRLLTELHKAAKKNERAFSPAWVEARIAELNKLRMNARYRFASQVATCLGYTTPDPLLIASQEGLNRLVRASLEERRALLQNLNNLHDARQAALAETTNLLETTARLARQMFEKLMPAADVNMTTLGLVLADQNRSLSEKSQAAQRTLFTSGAIHDATPIEPSIQQGKDQYFLTQLAILADSVVASFPQVKSDVEAIQNGRRRITLADGGGEIDNPPTPRTGIVDDDRPTAFHALVNLLDPRFPQILSAALQLLASGATAVPNTSVSPKMTLLLDKNIQVQADLLVHRTRHDPTGATARLPAPITVGPQHLFNWVLRPFVPGLYTNEPKYTIWRQIIVAPINDTVPEYADDKRQLTNLYATFGPKRAATWNLVQLAMRGVEGAGLDDSDNFIYQLHQNLTLLLDKPAGDLGLRGDNTPILKQPGLDAIVELISLLNTGVSLEDLSSRIRQLVQRPPGVALPANWHARVFRATNSLVQVVDALERFVDAWEPSLLLDIRFAALTVVARYSLIRTFLLDLDLIVREYLTQLQRRQRQAVSEARVQLEEETETQHGAPQTAESLQWKWLPEHLNFDVIYGTHLDDAIAQAAEFVRETDYFPRLKVQTAAWIAPSEKWGDEAVAFTILFAAIAAWHIKIPGMTQTGIYLEQTKYQNMNAAQRILIRRLRGFEYVLEPGGKEGYFRRRRRHLPSPLLL